jgi:hypothetical protein
MSPRAQGAPVLAGRARLQPLLLLAEPPPVPLELVGPPPLALVPLALFEPVVAVPLVAPVPPVLPAPLEPPVLFGCVNEQ